MSFITCATRSDSLPPASVILNGTKSPFFLRERNHGLFLLPHAFAVAPSRGRIEFPGHRGLRSPEIPSVGPYKEPEIHLGRGHESRAAAGVVDHAAKTEREKNGQEEAGAATPGIRAWRRERGGQRRREKLQARKSKSIIGTRLGHSDRKGNRGVFVGLGSAGSPTPWLRFRALWVSPLP